MTANLERSYRTMANRARSSRLPDDWTEAVVDPGDVPDGYDPSVFRGVVFGLLISIVPWSLIYLLFRAFAG